MNKPPILGNITPIIAAGGDIEKSISFYEEQLGFTTLYKEGNPVEMAIIKRDSAQIILQRNDDRHLAEWTTFRIQVDGIEQLYNHLVTKLNLVVTNAYRFVTKLNLVVTNTYRFVTKLNLVVTNAYRFLTKLSF